MAIVAGRPRIITSPAVVLTDPKWAHNVAGAIRSCSCFGISTLIWTGERVNPETMDRLPREERMKGYRDVYWEMNQRPFDLFPDAIPVCIELVPNAENLVTFEHPENAVYIFGPEDGSVPQVFRRHCHRFLFIPSAHCLNLSTALAIVLYDRIAKRTAAGLEPLACDDILQETRGEIELSGWDGNHG